MVLVGVRGRLDAGAVERGGHTFREVRQFPDPDGQPLILLRPPGAVVAPGPDAKVQEVMAVVLGRHVRSAPESGHPCLIVRVPPHPVPHQRFVQTNFESTERDQPFGVPRSGQPEIELCRRQVMPFFERLEPCLIGMEAYFLFWDRTFLRSFIEIGAPFPANFCSTFSQNR